VIYFKILLLISLGGTEESYQDSWPRLVPLGHLPKFIPVTEYKTPGLP
jgi:hypothetical protein